MKTTTPITTPILTPIPTPSTIARPIALFLVSCLLIGCSSQSQAPDGYIALFNGKNLDNWEQKGGEAIYTIEDDSIVGTTVANTPNSFLTTRERYSDFILELEFKVHPKLNSGVQIRSNAYEEDTVVKTKSSSGQVNEKKVPAGRVHGYQVEIDPDIERGRLWTGGIYDEGRRGWLNNLDGNDAARMAFKGGEWNRFLIICDGDSIKTWINGVPAADLTDDMTPEGFIALQVHGIGKDEEKLGHTVRWRNIYLQDLTKIKP
ncbi:MAG: 3-keto-disaccharide hydrolase [Planctomycetota bacterium]|jgi:hypothetical protein